MSAGAEPGAVSNGATGSGECREPEGSVPLPTSAECPFGRLYCKVFARTGDLSLAGDGRRTTKKATVVNDIGRKGLDRSNSVVAAVLSGFANGCEFCHYGCYQFYRQRKPPYVLSAVSGSSNSGDSSSKHGASSDGGSSSNNRLDRGLNG